jgi:hypothetical protein
VVLIKISDRFDALAVFTLLAKLTAVLYAAACATSRLETRHSDARRSCSRPFTVYLTALAATSSARMVSE